jgi:mannose-1-phosphate guanylyltransferase
MRVVIQSGGAGTRLRPFTSVLPKPLMPIGARPVLELLLKSLRRHGLEEIYITTGYLGHLIQSFCGDGSQWGMKIQYTIEKEPLGTVGALSLLRDQLDSTFLMLNGDVLTDLDIRQFTSSHRKKRSLLTVATTARTTRLDYGVIDETKGQVTRFREKPTVSHLVSMGVYCIEPKLLSYIPLGTPFGFDDFVHCLMEKRVPIHTFMHKGFWMDIGRIEDFKKAQEMDLDNKPGVERAWEFLNDVECL